MVRPLKIMIPYIYEQSLDYQTICVKVWCWPCLQGRHGHLVGHWGDHQGDFSLQVLPASTFGVCHCDRSPTESQISRCHSNTGLIDAISSLSLPKRAHMCVFLRYHGFFLYFCASYSFYVFAIVIDRPRVADFTMSLQHQSDWFTPKAE